MLELRSARVAGRSVADLPESRVLRAGRPMTSWILMIVAVTFAVLNTALTAATNTWTFLSIVNVVIAVGGSLYLWVHRTEWHE